MSYGSCGDFFAEGCLFEVPALLIGVLVSSMPQLHLYLSRLLLHPYTVSAYRCSSFFSLPHCAHAIHTSHFILNQVAQLPLSVSDGRWHHICITWTTRDGFWEAYQDGERLGTGDNLAPWHPIKPGGVIILGQEQVRAIEKL